MRNVQIAKSPRSSGSRSSGFTLIELLVVVGIMAVMLSVAAVGLQNVDKGQATVTGIAQVQALMDEARSTAVGRGTRARLCIHSSSQEEDRNLTLMIVAFEELERDNAGEIIGRSWRTASRGTYLPPSVYFHPERSRVAAGQSGVGDFGTKDESIRFPGGYNVSRGPDYYYYEFNAEGLCLQQDATQAGAAFVLCRGVTGPNAIVPKVLGNDLDGFVVWRNGRISKIRNLGLIGNQ